MCGKRGDYNLHDMSKPKKNANGEWEASNSSMTLCGDPASDVSIDYVW